MTPLSNMLDSPATGTVRGVLCFTCNAALAQLQDDSAIRRRAAAHVEGQGDDRRAMGCLSRQCGGGRSTASREELRGVVAEEIGETRAAGSEEGSR